MQGYLNYSYVCIAGTRVIQNTSEVYFYPVFYTKTVKHKFDKSHFYKISHTEGKKWTKFEFIDF